MSSRIVIKNCHQKIVIENCHQKLSSTILIKCFKGHKSQGSLCSVVKTLIVSGAGPRDGQWVLLSCCGQLKTSQELRMLSSVTINCQVTKIVMIPLIKCLKGHKSLGSLCSVVKTLIVSGAQARDGQWVLLSCSGQLKIEDYSLMFNERIIRIEDMNLTPLKEMITFQKAISLSFQGG